MFCRRILIFARRIETRILTYAEAIWCDDTEWGIWVMRRQLITVIPPIAIKGDASRIVAAREDQYVPRFSERSHDNLCALQCLLNSSSPQKTSFCVIIAVSPWVWWTFPPAITNHHQILIIIIIIITNHRDQSSKKLGKHLNEAVNTYKI